MVVSQQDSVLTDSIGYFKVSKSESKIFANCSPLIVVIFKEGYKKHYLPEAKNANSDTAIIYLERE